ncbi:unnamed protein product [Lactuca saligna]|uniref:Uncharacterized protein n=1 Tax=Lactuca saligna TaxID=75948 RepID=A0AA35Y2L6_LACSI|nr:unnamed protein product [Lactuca saligna]
MTPSLFHVRFEHKPSYRALSSEHQESHPKRTNFKHEPNVRSRFVPIPLIIPQGESPFPDSFQLHQSKRIHINERRTFRSELVTQMFVRSFIGK